MADKVAIGFSADTKQAQREMRTLGGSFGKLGQIATSTEGKFLAAGAAIVAIGAGVVVATKAFIGNADAVAKAGDNIAKNARIVGTSARSYQGLAFAADRAGISMSSVDNGLKRLSRNMFDANATGGRMAKTFEDMGIEFKDAVTGGLRPADDVLKDIADRVKKMGTESTTGELMTVLGRSGADMANLLAGGSEEIERLSIRLEDLGAVMSQELLDASEAYQDSLTDLKFAFQGIKNSLAEDVIPVLTRFIQYVTETAVPALSNFGESVASIPEFFMDLGASALDAVPGLDGFAAALDRIRERERLLEVERAKNRKAAAIARGSSAIPEDIDISGTLAGMSRTIGGTGTGKPAVVAGKKGRTKGAKAESDPFAEMVSGMQTTFADMQSIFFDPYLAELESQNTAEQALADQQAQRADEQSARMAAQLAEWRQVSDAQMQLSGDVFGAVSSFAELAQTAVEDSYFGQTKAGKAAATAAFVIAKAAALAQAAVQTALGITNALATPTLNPAVNAALAVGVGVAGAVQIGTIAATTIQGLADGGLAPGDLKRAGLNNHTVIGVRNDEMVVDPKGTADISAMFAMMRREKEMSMMERGANSAPPAVVVNLDGRRVSDGLAPHQTAMIEDGRDPRRNVRTVGAL